MLSKQKEPQPRRAWAEDWKHVERGLFAAACGPRDKRWLHERRQPEESLTAAQVGLYENASSLVFGVDHAKDLVIEGFARGGTKKDGDKLARVADALREEARKRLEEERAQKPADKETLQAIHFFDEVLKQSRIEHEGASIRWRSQVSIGLPDLMAVFEAEF
jgi:hypothetical protein